VHLFLGEGSDADSTSPVVAALKARLSSEATARGRSVSEYLAALLRECVAEEKFFECVQLLLQLFPLVHAAAVPGGGSSKDHVRHFEHALARTELVWSLVLLRAYYERFRPLQQRDAQELAQESSVAASSTRGGPGHNKKLRGKAIMPRIVNAATPFHLLPLAEGSASVELADPSDGVTGGGGGSGAHGSSSAKPLLAQAFLDAVLHKVATHFEQHQALQQAFDAYVRSIAVTSATASVAELPPSNPLPLHPLLGSLLIFWQIPSPHSLRAGIHTLRQQLAQLQAQPRASTALPASFAAATQRLLLAGLLWPQLSPAAVRALLRAAGV
jgi:hypothetical protein